MVFGDPNNFAILVEKIECWTVDGNYENGLFHYVINGFFLPDIAGVATLSGDISCLACENSLVAFPEDHSVFRMPKQEAFKFMLRSMLPLLVDAEEEILDDFEADYKYQASTYNIEDNGCYVFAVSSGDNVRILGAKVSYPLLGDSGGGWGIIDHVVVHEAFLSRAAVSEIICSVRGFL